MNIFAKFRSVRFQSRLLILLSMLGVWSIWQMNTQGSILYPPRITMNPPHPCVAIRPVFGPYQEAVIETPGVNCVVVNFWQQRLSDFAGHTGPTPDHDLLSIYANDVTVELANHILHSDGHSSGIFAARLEEKDRPVSRNITIRNGVLDLRGLGTAVKVIDHWPMYEIDTPAPTDFPGFKKSGIVLENLLIKTDNVGVILEGDGNIIRDCVIESAGDSAIMMAGPNGQILNNKIVLLDPFVPTGLKPRGYIDQLIHLREFRKLPRAAIVLHRADGTVIAGNRIDVKGKSETRHNIYLTDASIGVRIQGNTFVGADAPVTLRHGSTAELRDNTFEKREAWWPP